MPYGISAALSSNSRCRQKSGIEGRSLARDGTPAAVEEDDDDDEEEEEEEDDEEDEEEDEN